MATKAKTEIKKSPVYLLFGADDFEVGRAAQELVEKLCPPAEQDFGLDIINGKVTKAEDGVVAIDQCLNAIRTVSFFGSGRTVWLRDATFLTPMRGAGGGSSAGDGDGDDAADGGEVDAGGGGIPQDVKDRLVLLVDLIKQGIPEGQKLVISAGKINKALALYKAIVAAGEVKEFSPPDNFKDAADATDETLDEAFKAAKLKMGPNVREVFLDRSGGNTRQIFNEVEKLALYIAPRTEVKVEDVLAIVSATREAVAWDLTDAFTARNLPLALARLRHLLSQKTAPQLLISVLEARLRDMIVLKHSIDRRWLSVSRRGDRVFTEWRPAAEADAALGRMEKDPRKMHWFPLSKIVDKLHLYTSDELVRAHRLISEAHERMVSAPVPADLLIEQVIVAIMRGGRRAAG